MHSCRKTSRYQGTHSLRNNAIPVCGVFTLRQKADHLKADHLENLIKILILWPYLPDSLIQKVWRRPKSVHFNKYPVCSWHRAVLGAAATPAGYQGRGIYRHRVHLHDQQAFFGKTGIENSGNTSTISARWWQEQELPHFLSRKSHVQGRNWQERVLRDGDEQKRAPGSLGAKNSRNWCLFPLSTTQRPPEDPAYVSHCACSSWPQCLVFGGSKLQPQPVSHDTAPGTRPHFSEVF